MTSKQSLPIDGNTLSLQHAARGRTPVASPAQVTNVCYAGLFEAGSGGYSLWNTSSWQDFVNNWQQASAQGLRLCSFDTDEETQGGTAYLGAYVQMSGGDALWRTADWSFFLQQFNANAASMRLLDFDIHPDGGTRYFTGAWGGTPVNQTLVHDLGWDDFVAKWKELSAKNMRLTKVQVYPAADGFHLTGLYEAGSGGYAFMMTSDRTQFLQYYNQNQGTMQLTDFEIYDQAPTRFYVGVWRETSIGHRFIYDLDWGSFTSQWQQLSAQGLRLKRVIRYANPIELPEPDWAEYFKANLGSAAGYAFAVARNGQIVAQGASGQARTSADPPATNWAVGTRIHLASVSKPVTAVATLAMLAAKGLSVNDPFYPLIKSKCPQAGPGVNTVTIANLLTMKSGMVVDGTLNVTDMWAFLSQYLQQGLVGTPGVTYAYSNTNFTILQAIIALLADPANQGGNGIDPYVKFVSDHVLTPMGIATSDFNPVPAPQSTSSLTYSANDTRPGQYWGELDCVGPGGWVASAVQLLKFAIGVRNNKVLKPETTTAMLLNGYGWYTYDGIYGQYFHHNGGLLNGATPPQGLVTGVIHLADGYDAVLLVNSWGFDTIGLMVNAFEQRGLAAARRHAA